MKWIKSVFVMGLIVCSMASFSCGSSSPALVDAMDPEKKIFFGDLIENIEIIPLEFHHSSGFGEVERIAVFENQIFILDPTFTKSVQVYGLTGEYMRTIKSFENTAIWDFIIDEQKEEMVLFVLGNKFERFSMSGEYLGSQNSDFPVLSMLFVNDGGMMCDLGQQVMDDGQNFNLAYMDRQKYTVQSFQIPFREEPILVQDRIRNYAINGADTYFAPPFDNNIYKLDGSGNVETVVNLDFKSKLFSIEAFNNSKISGEDKFITGMDGMSYAKGKLFFHFLNGEDTNFRYFDFESDKLFALGFGKDIPSFLYQFILMNYNFEYQEGLITVLDLDYLRPLLAGGNQDLPFDLQNILMGEALFAIVKIKFL
ncbi:6-bladed beta-propeller [Rhodonellum sp.]|uniref:6-bladed beta-propeller n=1 Tax=Rhodonellum sp. TaxID=2231180 RepID=UPI0027275EB4|nr:6-bladed beta-propeller [Rhodonellum sp.]MDO9552517.1 6-bladed beta-propeller [Rhodonellum sp.]